MSQELVEERRREHEQYLRCVAPPDPTELAEARRLLETVFCGPIPTGPLGRSTTIYDGVDWRALPVTHEMSSFMDYTTTIGYRWVLPGVILHIVAGTLHAWDISYLVENDGLTVEALANPLRVRPEQVPVLRAIFRRNRVRSDDFWMWRNALVAWDGWPEDTASQWMMEARARCEQDPVLSADPVRLEAFLCELDEKYAPTG